ncbi:MAG: 1-acyl-sn-glycerol-3-phosphate acyltransferase [Muribaculaceae bacterium]|nr:1-acyl-sn-glycerol-3-phosphate acyltransferase [Muribaculaceae bacterium]
MEKNSLQDTITENFYSPDVAQNPPGEPQHKYRLSLGKRKAEVVPAPGVRPDVINFHDVVKLAPALATHPKLVNRLLKFLAIDKVNFVHGKFSDRLGVDFATALTKEEYLWDLKVDNYEVLEKFKTGPFITVSNHPIGSYDGIILLHLVGSVRRDYRVMVNLILNNLQAMRPGFIAVDPQKSSDPEKRKITMHGMREAIQHVKNGHPLGFFPAGAISNVDWKLEIADREWQEVIIRLIRQLQVPVIPIYFHCKNSTFCNILGKIDWRLRTMRLPGELFSSYGKKIRVSFGDPISVEDQNKFETLPELGAFLRAKTYELKDIYKNG